MSYTCPTCGMTSHNPNDEKYQYCGNCRKYEEDRAFGFFQVEHPYSEYSQQKYWLVHIPQLRVILAQDSNKGNILKRLYELAGNLEGVIKYLEEYEDLSEKET